MMPGSKSIKIIECPRDAMQGWPHAIDTATKVRYLNCLLKVGFHTLDFGSFVSPKAIPQMADTREVLSQLDLSQTKTKLLAIIANQRGAEEALSFPPIDFLGYPFSISETFQQRNTNKSISDSFELVQEIQNLCVKNNTELVVYLSMGFGNPYGDPFHEDIVLHWGRKLADVGIGIISLADTVGLASPSLVRSVTSALVEALPDVEIGVHLHASPTQRIEKLQAALDAGSNRFDGALRGIGGCPMAGDQLVGNMDTETMLRFFEEQHYPLNQINRDALQEAILLAAEVFV